MISKYLQISFALLLGLSLACYPIFINTLPLKPLQVLGLLVSFSAFAFWYFDSRLAGVIQHLEDGLKDHIAERSLTQAINYVTETKKHWKHVRVLATSTGQIQPLFAASGLSADSVHIILRRLTEVERTDTLLADFANTIERMTEEWRNLEKKGRIRELVLQSYSGFPLEYNVIFDEEILIAGLLMPEPNRFSDVNVETPTITVGRTRSGTREIRKYINRFDNFAAFIRSKDS